jgi:signal transduction histidine kinase
MANIKLADQKSYAALAPHPALPSNPDSVLWVAPDGKLCPAPKLLELLPQEFLDYLPPPSRVELQRLWDTIGAQEKSTINTRLIFPHQNHYPAHVSVLRVDSMHQIMIHPYNHTTSHVITQQNRALEALSKVAEAVSTQLSVDTVLQEALDQTLATLHVEAGAITLLDEAKEKLIFRVQKGWQVHNFVESQIHLQPDAGLSGLAMQTGLPVVTADITKDERIAVQAFRDEPVKAMVLAPLRARNSVLGLLSVMSYQPRQFLEGEVSLLAAIADQVGVALHNARLYEQEQARRREAEALLASEQRHAHELNILRDTIMRMTNTTDLLTLLEHLAHAALDLAGATACEIDLYDVAQDYLTFGLAQNQDGARRPLCAAPHRTPILREAVEEKRPIIASFDPSDKQLLDPAITYALAIPMKHQTCNGVLLLGYDHAPNLQEQIRNSLSLLAEQASLALDRLRLYKQERLKAHHLALVNHISRTAEEEIHDEMLLNDVVRMIRQGFNFYNVSLYLDDPLTLQASSGGQPAFPGAITREGLAVRAQQQQRPMLSNRITEDERCMAPPWVRGNIQSEMAIPIIHRHHVIGVLDLFSVEAGVFDNITVQTLNTLASQLAVVIENGQLYGQMKRRIAELTAIQDIILPLLSARDTKTVARTILRPFLDVLEADTVILYPVQKEQIQTHRKQIAKQKQNYIIPLVDGDLIPLCEEALTLRETIWTGQLQGVPGQHWTQSKPVGNVLVCPLSDWGAVQGLLAIQYQEPTTLTEADQQTFHLLTQLASVALSKAKIYEESQQQVQELSLLYKIALKTRALTSPHEIAEVATEALRNILGWFKAEVYRWDASSARLILMQAPSEDPPCSLKLGEGPVGWAGEHRRLYRIPAQGTYGDPPHTELAVPMMIGDRLIGALHIQGKPSTCETSDENFLTTVAHLLAVILDNVALYEQVRQQLHETKTLYNDLESRNQRLNDAYAQLKDLSDLKDQIIQNVSHELRTPLTFIKGYVELLSEGNMGPINAEQQESLAIVTQKSEDIIHIVNEIISLQAIDRRTLHQRAFELTSILKSVTMLIEKRWASHPPHTFHLPSTDKSLKIWADPEKIQQLCYNIIDNAVKFSPNGGTIALDIVPEGDFAHITCQDEGIGIPQDELEKIFETFYQIDGSATRQFGGLGLGLAVAQRIVKVHNGDIWAESTVGKGSTFHVLLPRYTPSNEGTQQP